MRRVLRIAAIAVALALVFAGLGWLMMPRWRMTPYTDHITVATEDPAIRPAHTVTAHEGDYRVKETSLNITMDDGTSLPAILREPVKAPGKRPACLFVHGSGTADAKDFGDIAHAMASAGIVTLVPAKRLDNYTPLHRDYERFAHDYGQSLAELRGMDTVDPQRTGIYAESEGTWIATLMTAGDASSIAFAILSSAPVFKGREQMAMAVSAYVHQTGAPTPVVRDMAKLVSMDYAPFDLKYADFEASRYLDSLTMPILVNYGTYDTAMPIEQGAQRIIAAARQAGNENVTVRYFAANHQMRAGKGLFAPNLPLADQYTRVLGDWVNGVAAGTEADEWETAQIAGVQPHQRFAAPQRMDSGIIGSLGALIGLMVAGPVLMLFAAILGAVLLASNRSAGRAKRIARRRDIWDEPFPHRLCARRAQLNGRSAWPVAERRVPHDMARMSVGIGIAVVTVTVLLYGYMSAVGVAAFFERPQHLLLIVGWSALQVMAVLLLVLFAWELERMWRYRNDITGLRRAIALVVALAAICTLTVLAFWGLFSL